MKVSDIDLYEINNFSELLNAYGEGGGFIAKNVNLALETLLEMYNDKDCVVFLAFTADVVATGLRGVLKTIVEKGFADVILTTVGSLDHDIARSHKQYLQGSFHAQDKDLLKKNIHRLGNIFVPRDSYGDILEKVLQPVFNDMWEKNIREISSYEFTDILGSKIAKKDSILYWASKNRVPVIIPGPLDGAVGSQLWFFQQAHRDLRLNLFKDETLLSDITFEAKKTGAIIIGGGISKHHLLWWNQFRGGLDYAVQITTATEFDGSLSGARLSEAVSWGKISEKAKYVDVWCEATVVTPLIFKSVLEKINTRKKGKDFI